MKNRGVTALRDSIKVIMANLEPLKAAVVEQARIIASYRRLIEDIERGVKHDHTYTVAGLLNGIEQAEYHIERINHVRDIERERIKTCQQMIHDIKKAEMDKKHAEEAVVVEYVRVEDDESESN